MRGKDTSMRGCFHDGNRVLFADKHPPFQDSFPEGKGFCHLLDFLTSHVQENIVGVGKRNIFQLGNCNMDSSHGGTLHP